MNFNCLKADLNIFIPTHNCCQTSVIRDFQNNINVSYHNGLETQDIFKYTTCVNRLAPHRYSNASKSKEDFKSQIENFERFLLASPLGIPGCSNHLKGIKMNTTTWVFKCALTYTYSIVGWGFSLPYRGTSITFGQSHFIVTYSLGQRFAPMSLLSCTCIHKLHREYK